jgi:hypothetical protein
MKDTDINKWLYLYFGGATVLHPHVLYAVTHQLQCRCCIGINLMPAGGEEGGGATLETKCDGGLLVPRNFGIVQTSWNCVAANTKRK